MDQERLFYLPHDVAHVHMAWAADTGWSVWLSTWERALGPAGSSPDEYEHLTLEEALQVVEDVMAARLAHLRGRSYRR